MKNVVDSSKYVSEFRLDDYPVGPDDVLHTGRAAFDAALNTVNVGKFNLCTASIGICEHAMYEAVTHAHNRILYGRPVTAFPHVRRELTDAYVRLAGMKLFSDRAVDYFRSAGPDDRRYLLFNPMTKMKVTTEGEKVIDLMWTSSPPRDSRRTPTSPRPPPRSGGCRSWRARSTSTSR